MFYFSSIVNIFSIMPQTNINFCDYNKRSYFSKILQTTRVVLGLFLAFYFNCL
ncbi:hypothetical protein MHA_1860 [Mannheimia haemolytica PHL213]|nr:hypothetical protein MHA_1860 [Mannheimia haemolytica PHL213]